MFIDFEKGHMGGNIMEVVKVILTIVYVIVCLSIIVLTFLQKKGQAGLSGTITGSSSSENFYEKNKGRTKEGSLRKWTIIQGIVFGVMSILLSILYVM